MTPAFDLRRAQVAPSLSRGAEATARKLLFATTNPNKLREVRHVLEAFSCRAPRNVVPDELAGYELVTLAEVGPVPEPEESGATFWENARIKALAYAAATGLTTVAEDSGFEIDALGGAPGIHSARFLGPTASYPDRFAEIYRRLSADKPQGLSPQTSFSDKPQGLSPQTSFSDKPQGLSPHTLFRGDNPLGLSFSARFVTALAVARGHELLFETETAIEGTVATAPSGHHGFGYDPIFWYPPFRQTTADVSDDDKTAVSHRARAFRDLRRWLMAPAPK